MAVEAADFLDDLNSTNPEATDQVKQGDDHIRLLKAVLKSTFPGLTRAFYLEKPRENLASAATPNLGATTSNFVNLTGTTTITGFAGGVMGMQKLLRFDGVLQLTHHGTSFSIQTAQNIITEAGDYAIAICEDENDWSIPLYIRNSGIPVGNPFPIIGAADIGKFLEATDDSPQARAWGRPVFAGAVVACPSTTIPSGWLLCNGQAVSRTTYPALFGFIGTAYGVGDGSTTFNLPDYRGEFLRGLDEGTGRDPDRGSRTNRGDGTTGDNIGTRQDDMLESHSHNLTRVGDNNFDTLQPPAGSTGGNIQFRDEPVSFTGGNETRPRNVTVRWVIKAH